MRISDWSSDVCSSDLAAAHVLPFSRHVGEDVVSHYGVPWEKVFAVGCGSGPIPSFEGTKNYADGDLLFVAQQDMTSVVQGKSVSGRVDPGGRSVIKQKKIPNSETLLKAQYTRY